MTRKRHNFPNYVIYTSSPGYPSDRSVAVVPTRVIMECPNCDWKVDTSAEDPVADAFTQLAEHRKEC